MLLARRATSELCINKFTSTVQNTLKIKHHFVEKAAFKNVDVIIVPEIGAIFVHYRRFSDNVIKAWKYVQ